MISRFLAIAVVVIGFSGSARAGYLEICKDDMPPGSLSGLFSFTIAGQAGTFNTPVGACTPALVLPDGPAMITEVPQAGSAIFGVDTFPATRLDSFDPATGTARVEIVAGDISTQTVLTFTNIPVSAAIPEPRTAWLLGVGLAFWAIRLHLSADSRWSERR